MSLKKVINGKLTNIEENLKIVFELLVEIQTDRAFIEYLLEKEDDEPETES